MPFFENWSLKRSPFARFSTADSFFSGGSQREALARLHYMVESGQGCALLISPWGCGATTLLRHVAGSSGFGDTAVDVVMTNHHGKKAEDVLRSLAVQLGALDHSAMLWRNVLERTIASARQQVRTLWLVDDATPEAAQWAGRLTSENRWVTAVLTTGRDNVSAIAGNLGACPLRIDLEPLSLQDTFNYIAQAIAAAGGQGEIFSDSAVVRLHEIAEGRIAVIARLAELAMQTAAGHDLQKISSDLVEVVQSEFVRAA
ncbi:MAG: hypothetical protein WD119_01700 [Pirellulaceae bacterium]